MVASEGLAQAAALDRKWVVACEGLAQAAALDRKWAADYAGLAQAADSEGPAQAADCEAVGQPARRLHARPPSNRRPGCSGTTGGRAAQ